MVGDAVVYQMGDKQFINGNPSINPGHLASAEIYACTDKIMLVNEMATELRKQWEGKFV
jgi:hypothetical protein